MPRSDTRFTAKIVLAVVLCLAVLAALALLLVLPVRERIADMDARIAERRADIADKRQLAPVLADLRRQREELAAYERLPLPAPSPVTAEGLDRVVAALGEFARETNMTVDRVSPQPVDLGEAGNLLRVDADLRGDFFAFRGFLTRLGGLPSLRHVEQVQVRSLPGTLGFSLRVYLELESGESGSQGAAPAQAGATEKG